VITDSNRIDSVLRHSKAMVAKKVYMFTVWKQHNNDLFQRNEQQFILILSEFQ